MLVYGVHMVCIYVSAYGVYVSVVYGGYGGYGGYGVC